MPLIPAPALMLGSVLCIQIGQAFGKQLSGDTGPAGVIALPLGVASTLQLLGPLTLALLSSRRLFDFCFSALAAFGVWLCHNPVTGPLPLAGVLLALASAVAMGAYLLLSRRAGAHSADGSALAWAVTLAAVLTIPFGIAENGTTLLRPTVLLAGAGVAVPSAALPYSLELAALRRMPPGAVAVLVSLEPAVAGIAGVVILSEQLNLTAWLGIGCVTIAAAGITVRLQRVARRIKESSRSTTRLLVVLAD